MVHNSKHRQPSAAVSAIPVIFLIVALLYVLITEGTDAISGTSQIILLCSAAIAFIISRLFYPCSWRMFRIGFAKSSKQILPAIPILLLISTVSATWMLGGVVPTLIYYGLEFINPSSFLIITCLVCSVVSVLTGSSWTTCATIGVAFMGIGTIMGYNEAWIAGAIISGAYFGDKVSPLSDTTVLASSTCGVELFKHIKYLMITTIPAMAISLIVFACMGFLHDSTNGANPQELISIIENTFTISPWLLLIPVTTCVLIVSRVNVLITLSISTALGVVGLFVFEHSILVSLAANSSQLSAIFEILFTSTSIETHNSLLNDLVSTGGVEGMLNTIYLILCAMTFGGVLLGTGMLSSITHNVLHRLHTATKTVYSTLGSGLFMNCCTGDQYLSLIITGNLYKNLYKKNNLEQRLLSRSLEDSISVTSVLIPWNSCGITQSTVLGVPTLTYLPFCFFNYLCPLMSGIIVYSGYKIFYSNANISSKKANLLTAE